MIFQNPTRLSKMTELELQAEIDLRTEDLWEKPENRERIDDCYRELNSRAGIARRYVSYMEKQRKLN